VNKELSVAPALKAVALANVFTSLRPPTA